MYPKDTVNCWGEYIEELFEDERAETDVLVGEDDDGREIVEEQIGYFKFKARVSCRSR